MNKLVLLAVLLALLIGPAAAMADDLKPPWWRGMDGTTSQIWEFLDDVADQIPPDGPAPEGLPYLPSTMISVVPGEGMGWLQMDLESGSDREGIWQLSGRMDVIVDNLDPWNKEKWIQVQLTWQPQGAGAMPIFDYIDPPPAPNYPLIWVDQPLDFGWMHSTYEWRLDHNPPDEFFGFSGDINVDELVIDTWCVPEPSTLVMLAVGAFGLLICLRRRRR